MPDASPALRFSNVGKTFPLYETPGQRALDAFGFYRLVPRALRPQFPSFDALADISFSVSKGERVGVIGRNGAGKTSLLKLVTDNFKPSRGTIERNGTVHSLMQTGIGFSNEMTGRENIHAALAYNGLPESEMLRVVDEIIDFCELGDHLDQPLKTYSLGMGSRLQFAVATAVDPDILIIDEILGAGDVYFTHKSAARMKGFVERGATMLIVSHSMQQILEFCDRVIWLDRGRLVMDGPALEVIDAYEVYLERLSRLGISSEDPQSRFEPPATPDEMKTLLYDGKEVYRWPGKEGVKIASLSLENSAGPTTRLLLGEPLKIRLSLHAEKGGDYVCRYVITLWTAAGRRVCRIENEEDRFSAMAGERRDIRFENPAQILTRGRYFVSFSVYDVSKNGSSADPQTRYDMLAHAVDFEIPTTGSNADFLVQHPVRVSITRHAGV